MRLSAWKTWQIGFIHHGVTGLSVQRWTGIPCPENHRAGKHKFSVPFFMPHS